MVIRKIIRKDGQIQKYNIKDIKKFNERYFKTQYGFFNKKLNLDYNIKEKIKGKNKIILESITEFVLDKKYLKMNEVDNFELKNFNVAKNTAVKMIFEINQFINGKSPYFNEQKNMLRAKINSILKSIERLWRDKNLRYLSDRYAIVHSHVSVYNVYINTGFCKIMEFSKFQNQIIQIINNIITQKAETEYKGSDIFFDNITVIFECNMYTLNQLKIKRKFDINLT